jgi:hypothetical protein
MRLIPFEYCLRQRITPWMLRNMYLDANRVFWWDCRERLWSWTRDPDGLSRWKRYVVPDVPVETIRPGVPIPLRVVRVSEYPGSVGVLLKGHPSLFLLTRPQLRQDESTSAIVDVLPCYCKEASGTVYLHSIVHGLISTADGNAGIDEKGRLVILEFGKKYGPTAPPQVVSTPSGLAAVGFDHTGECRYVLFEDGSFGELPTVKSPASIQQITQGVGLDDPIRDVIVCRRFWQYRMCRLLVRTSSETYYYAEFHDSNDPNQVCRWDRVDEADWYDKSIVFRSDSDEVLLAALFLCSDPILIRVPTQNAFSDICYDFYIYKNTDAYLLAAVIDILGYVYLFEILLRRHWDGWRATDVQSIKPSPLNPDATVLLDWRVDGLTP